MKIRLYFVSNSSSSSWIDTFDGTNKSKSELLKLTIEAFEDFYGEDVTEESVHFNRIMRIVNDGKYARYVSA